MNDLEKWLDENTEVSGETAFKVIDVAHMMILAGEIFEWGGAAAVGTAAAPAAATGASVAAAVASGLAPIAMFAGGVYELFYAADAAAMADVKKKNFIMGYALGLASLAVGEGPQFTGRKFGRGSASAGGTTIQNQIAAAGASAWNAGLAMGYKHAAQMSYTKRKKLFNLLLTRLKNDRVASGRSIQVGTTEEDLIWALAGVFAKTAVK